MNNADTLSGYEKTLEEIRKVKNNISEKLNTMTFEEQQEYFRESRENIAKQMNCIIQYNPDGKSYKFEKKI